MRIALAGNPNSGKTTLFNALTGSNQFVGNWPGVTVEKKEGKLKKQDGVIVTDLPGIYSLSPYTLEEVIARNYLLNEKPDVILNIVDGTNIERNLYLTTQLAELGIPVVVAINMMDIVNKNGDEINTEKLSKELGCKVVVLSALKGTGVLEAADVAISESTKKSKTNHSFDKRIENTLEKISSYIKDLVPEEKLKWYSVKLFERDSRVIDSLSLSSETVSEISSLVDDIEADFDDDSESIITNERYNYVTDITKKCYKRRLEGKLTISDKIDKVVTNRWAALPIFAVIMFLVYFIAVTTVGTWVTDFTNDGLFGDGFHLFGIGESEYEEALDNYVSENDVMGKTSAILELNKSDVAGIDDIKSAIDANDIGALEEAIGSYGAQFETPEIDENGEIITLDAWFEGIMEEAPATEDFGVWVKGVPVFVGEWLEAINCAPWLTSLIIDGVVGGVGAVLGFVPQILVLFILLAFLEACGYMARIAFVLDRIFRKFGLSGKSFIPMLIGVGCSVPGIMAARTIENQSDRRMTIITTSFVPCGAKVPVIALIAGALFGGAWWVAPLAYFIGFGAVIISGIMLKKTKHFAGQTAPFIMELPAYHMPTVPNVLRSMWERGWSFIKKAGTIILLSTIFIWITSHFGMMDSRFGFSLDMELENSLLGYFGKAFSWIFIPLGFNNIQATVATFMGLIAKEEIVAVFGVLDLVGMTKLSAFSFLIFNLLCAPCFAAMGAIRREMNSAKWTLFAIGYQTGFAYIISLIVYQLGMLFIGNGNAFGVILAFVAIIGLLYMLFKPASFSLIKLIKGKKNEKVNQ